MYTQVVTHTKLALAQRHSHSLCELMKGQSKLLPLYCFTFRCSGGDGVEKHGPLCNSHVIPHGHIENDSEGLGQAEDYHIVYLDSVLGFAYPHCCLEDVVLAVLCNPSACCAIYSSQLPLWQTISILSITCVHTMQMAAKLGFYLGLRSVFNSVAISNHTLRPVKFCRGEKIIFSCCGRSHTFCHETSRKRKRKEEELVQKTATVWVLLWKCFALGVPTLLSICLSSHRNHSNKHNKALAGGF